jgi:hypothetical protein
MKTQSINQSIAHAMKYDGDAIAAVFIDALHDANFHTEGKVILTAWNAMSWASPSEGTVDKNKLIDAVIRAISSLKE